MSRDPERWSGRRAATVLVLLSALLWVPTGCAIHALLAANGLAAPVELTRQEARELTRIASGVNHRMDRWGPRRIGNCVAVAMAKHRAFLDRGVPADAMRLRIVAMPTRSLAPRHMLLDLDAIVDGRPWRVAFDMNSPWPLEPKHETAMGYRPLPAEDR